MNGADVDVNLLFRFFARKRNQYIEANLREEALACDKMIAEVSHIMCDPRIEP
jgi:hypothetical protein